MLLCRWPRVPAPVTPDRCSTLPRVRTLRQSRLRRSWLRPSRQTQQRVPHQPVRAALVVLGVLLLAGAGPRLQAQKIRRDVEYAQVAEHSLKLDLFVPAATKPVPLVIWVHGGAWRAGSKNRVPVKGLLDHGLAIASVDYRLSPVARFPAQIHDIKAAIRFLRAHSTQYGVDPEHFFVAGASAGGHLAALVGVSNDHVQLEGQVGDYPETSSRVQKAVSFYGASNLESILQQSTPFGLGVRGPALNLLLGEESAARTTLAQLASPVRHVDASDPPLLLIHGDQDPQMPINQTHELHGKYKQLHLPVHFEVIHGGAHGGASFYDDTKIRQVAEFLKHGQWK